MMGQDVFNAYVDGSYDSSGDFWKLMEDGSLQRSEDGWLKDSNGNYILDNNGERIGADGMQAGLQAIFEKFGFGNVNAATVMFNQGFTFLGEEGGYWNHDGNNGLSITLGNEQYRRMYENGLDQHNTLNIYNMLVDAGAMDIASVNWNVGQIDQYGNWTGRQPDVEYISYEQYKENNFMHNVGYDMVQLNRPPGPMESLFGIRNNPFTGLPGAQHTGVDFPLPNGTPINPMAAGVVDYIGSDNSLGNLLVMRHEMTYMYKGQERTSTFFTDYLHLQSNEQGQPNVNYGVGDFVGASAVAAYSGNTGLVAGENGGYHLHAGVFFQPPAQDPYANWLQMQGNLSFNRTRGNRTGVFFDPSLFW